MGTISARRGRLGSGIALQARAAAGDALAIREVRIHPVREPTSGRRYTLVRLETRSGLRGWGECTAASPRDFAEARRVLAEIPATAYEVAWRALESAPAIRPAVDMALLDIVGQHTKAPLYQVLGGPTRFKARALGTVSGDDPQQINDALERALKAGYRAYAVPTPRAAFPNSGQAFVFQARGRLEILRKAAGESADFVLDCGGRLTAGDAASLAAEFERYHLLWIDEPTSQASLGAIRKLADERVTPIGFGRAARDKSDFQNLLRDEAADVLRPDIAVHGISQIRRIAALAESYYVAVAPFHDGGPLATAAALHLAASLPNFFIQQVPPAASEQDREMRIALTGINVEQVTGGFFELPTGMGLGVSVNERVLNRYRDRT